MKSLTRVVALTASAVACLALSAAPSPASADTMKPASRHPVAIAVPMSLVPHATRPGSPRSNVVIPGNCGTAFLYPSNGHDHVHFDFGFKNLTISHYAVSGSIHALNIDNGDYASHSYSGASFSSTWEKQGNLDVRGEALVSGVIHAYGYVHDCVSSPNLSQYVYVY